MTPPAETHETAPGTRPPETVDRLMVGACGAIWVVYLVVAVIAGVALVNLGSGRGSAEHSSWPLYTVIGVSAAVIAGAIPLLIRARRTAMESAASTPAVAQLPVPSRSVEAPTEKIRVFGTTVDPHAPAPEPASAPRLHAVVERIWLRGTTSLLGAMGLALIAVATATYLLSVYSDTAAWVALGVAGIITAAMPVILVAYQRQLAAAS